MARVSSGEATTVDAAALRRWCEESPEHRAAFAGIARAWDMLLPVAAEAARRAPCPIGRDRPPRLARRAFLGGAAMAATTGAAVAVLHPPLSLWPSLSEMHADVRTGPGELRVIDVTGVSVHLNTRSSVDLQADGEVQLIAGEIVVTADRETGRAVVAVGDARVEAREGRVDVRHDGAGTCVACLDGTARVTRRSAQISLSGRQQVVFARAGFGEVSPVDPTVVTAWQQGQLVFRGEPLARVVDEVNRYRAGRIVLVDAALGRRLVDAVFHIDRLDAVTIYLEQAFSARITRLPAGLVLIG
ncbi:transmembrane sensor [Rhodoplanes tepidamans]|nr:transmembrane sensor [Rhodoplanes tepidamans]